MAESNQPRLHRVASKPLRGNLLTKKSSIPFGAQFSPSQIDLSSVLEIIHREAGSREAITSAILDQFFADHAQKAQWTLAGNTVLGLRDYGLLETDASMPTQLAGEMLAMTEQPCALYERFAKHILLNLRGIDVLDTVEAMQMAGETVTLHSLRNHLLQRGLDTPRGAVHLSSMRLWLARSGVFDASIKGGPRLWRFDPARVHQILGIGLDAIDSLSNLNRGQRAFLRALTCFPEEGPLVANKVADMASMLYGAH